MASANPENGKHVVESPLFRSSRTGSYLGALDADDDAAADVDVENTEEDDTFVASVVLPTTRTPSPWTTANIFSRLTIHWMTRIVVDARKPEFSKDSLPLNTDRTNPNVVVPKFQRFWKKYKRKYGESARLKWAFVRFYKFEVLGLIGWISVAGLCWLVNAAYFIRGLVDFIEDNDETNQRPLYEGVLLALGLGVSEWVRSTFIQQFWLQSSALGNNLKSLVSALAFEGCCNLEVLGSSFSAGEIINICTNDAERVFEAGRYIVTIYLALIMTIGVVIAGNILLGPTVVLGALIILTLVPLQLWSFKRIGKLRQMAILNTDKRVRKVSEFFGAAKLIKMYNWEGAFQKQVEVIRKREQDILHSSAYLNSILFALTFIVPTFAAMTTIAIHVALGEDITSSQAYAVIALYGSLFMPVATMPRAIKSIAEAQPGLVKLQNLMNLQLNVGKTSTPSDPNLAVEMKSATFSWPGNPLAAKNVTHGGETDIVVNDLSFGVRKGEVLAICGPIGAGKTSIISAMLGQMKLRSGVVATQGTIALVAQQAWIQADTVRNNICFGKSFDVEWYNKVVAACSLLTDFELLALGDLTVVGDRGINLSGGQKQRISLARAVYSDSDLYLLDDPLSAVDVHVGAHLFNECIRGVLKGKTIVFATHQLQYLSQCDNVLYVQGVGKVLHDTHANLIRSSPEFSNFVDVTEQSKTKPDTATKLSSSPTNVPTLPRPTQASPPPSTNGTQGHERVPLLSPQQHQDDEEEENEEGREEEQDEEHEEQVQQQQQQQQQQQRQQQQQHHHHHHQQQQQQQQQTPVKGDVITLPSPTSATTSMSPTPNQTTSNTLVNASTTPHHHHGTSTKSMTDTRDDDVYSPPKQRRYTVGFVRGSASLSTAATKQKIPWSTYKQYMSAIGGKCVFVTLMCMFPIALSGRPFVDWWVGYWIQQGNGTSVAGGIQENPDKTMYIMVYFLVGVAFMVLQAIKAFFFHRQMLAGSSRLHDQLFGRIIRAPMSFFDTTPAGQVLSRFSKDLDEIDSRLPELSDQFLSYSSMIVLALLVVCIVFPAFVIVFLLVFVCFYVLLTYFAPAQGKLKTLDNKASEPLLSHVATTFLGLSTVFAFDKRGDFIAKYAMLLEEYMSAVNYFFYAAAWFSIRLDVFSLVVLVSTALFGVLSRGTGSVSPNLFGLALTLVNSICGLFQFSSRLKAEVTARFSSADRIISFIRDVPQEDDSGTIAPDSQWPKYGKIEFDNVCSRYQPTMPFVLNHLSLTFDGGQKIGIVGRTGSGKSSLTLTLFRILSAEVGVIRIDDLDISKMPLASLRQKISVIPQDPVLFAGTIRYNLDPFDEYTDNDLWTALAKSHLDDVVKTYDLGLLFVVSENGENMSVGQRQLLCLARALLKDSRILLMDEATASVDNVTDAKIQETIRKSFVGGTVLMVAHRLETVLACDKILVLDKGHQLEFDSPKNLLADADSHFYKMHQMMAH